jgi:hypothetical protein
LSVEIKDKIKMEYGWLERTNFLWNVLEEIFGSSYDKKSLSNITDKISSSSTFFIRVKKGNQVLKKKKQNLPVWENWTVRFPKPDYPVLAEQKPP